MNEPPRRRRSEYDSGGGGLPIFPLIVAVIFIGLLLGSVLAHFFGGASVSASPAPSLTPMLQPTNRPTISPSATAPGSSKPSPRVSATPRTSPSPTPSPSASPKPKPKLLPSAEPSVFILTPSPSIAAPATVVPKPSVAPKPAASTSTPLNPSSTTGESGAAALVRAYLAALMRGDRSTATSYLSHGEPTETFMQADTRINNVTAKTNTDGSYHVTADVSAPGDQEYFITFTVEPGPFGMQITDHFFIKPH